MKKSGGGTDWSASDVIRWGVPPPDKDPNREVTLDELFLLMGGKRKH